MPAAAIEKAALDATEGALLTQPPLTTIETERLILRTLTMDALDDIMPLLTNPSIMKWTSQPPVQSTAEATKWLSTRCLGPNVFQFSIHLKDAHPPSASPETPPSIIGLIGSFHWPSCGYMINASFAGNGYATEALRAFIPAYFDRVPSPNEDGSGHDVLEGYADTENYASHRILEKCGFTKCETTIGDFENAVLGVRDTVAYRYPRPGKTLADLGFGRKPEDEEDPPEPPLQ